MGSCFIRTAYLGRACPIPGVGKAYVKRLVDEKHVSEEIP